jgi:hypothetical protein
MILRWVHAAVAEAAYGHDSRRLKFSSGRDIPCDDSPRPM